MSGRYRAGVPALQGRLAPRTAGLTRVDLLALLSMVALLAALGSASLATMRSRERLSACRANLQRINQAVLQYGIDHAETLPGADPSLPGELWWWYKEKVKGYAGLTGPSSESDTLFACPLDRGYSDPRPFCRTARFDYGSYVFNGVDLLTTPSIAGWRVSSVRQPQQTLLVMEWTAHAPLSWHRSRTGRANLPFYSDAESMLGFVDGHVNFSPVYYDGYNAAYTRNPIAGYDYKYSGN